MPRPRSRSRARRAQQCRTDGKRQDASHRSNIHGQTHQPRRRRTGNCSGVERLRRGGQDARAQAGSEPGGASAVAPRPAAHEPRQGAGIRVGVLTLAVLAALLLAPAFAGAHAYVVRTDPANGALLKTAPARVTVVWDEAITLGLGGAAGGARGLRPRRQAGRLRQRPTPRRRHAYGAAAAPLATTGPTRWDGR